MKRLTPADFLWSVKLGAQMRILQYDVPLKFEWSILQDGMRINKERIISCEKGQCILYYPKTETEPVFWTLPESELENQIKQGSLILNGIPSNWRQLKTG